MHRHPPPNLHDLLLTVIACLPTAFFSPSPPPVLLPLLSPILRQRVSLLSTDRSQNWLNLLTWSPARAADLIDIVSNLNLEPHPVSGELELFEDEPEVVRYRRLDSETTQAKCDVLKHGISVIWTWCTNDSGGTGIEALASSGTNGSSTQDGWRVAEVRPVEAEDTQDEEWHDSQGEAEAALSSTVSTAPPMSQSAHRAPSVQSEDDSDYWASYDRTPASRTPAKRSPAPPSSANLGALRPLTSTAPDAEAEYFARYGNEVQPALDQHDPEEEADPGEEFESTLGPGGRAQQSRMGVDTRHEPPTPPYDGEALGMGKMDAQTAGAVPLPAIEQTRETVVLDADAAAGTVAEPTILHSPRSSRPHSPQTSTTKALGPESSVEKLESAASASTAAEMGVKQHISTEMKSLYRLARAVGMEREEFERVVGREVEVLGMMDE